MYSNVFVYKRPAIPIVFCIATGIIIGEKFPGYSFIGYGIAAIAAICVFISIHKRSSLSVIPVVFLIAVGYLIVPPVSSESVRIDHISAYRNKTSYRISGVVEGEPQKKQHSTVFILKTELLESDGGKQSEVSGKIRVSYYGSSVQVNVGDSISIYSSIRPFRNFYNPGGFDYENHMKMKGIWGSAYVRDGGITLIRRSGTGILNLFRHTIESHIDTAVSSSEVAGVLKALITGNRNDVSKIQKERFNRTGTGHLLAISGLHIGIVGTVTFFLICRVLSYCDILLWQGRVKKVAGVSALIPVIMYGVISGMSPSTQRAVVMVSIVLVAYCFEAEGDIFNTLAIAAMVILSVFPHSLFSVSFQLSFTAVISICIGMLVVKQDASIVSVSLAGTIRRYIVSYFQVSLFAFMGTLPLVAAYFNQVSLIGPVANVLMVPLVALCVVPVALSGVVLLPLLSGVSDMCFVVAGFFLEKALSLNIILADAPFASVRVITPSVVEILCYYVIVFSLLSVVYVKSEGWHKVRRKAIVVMIFGFIATGADIAYWTDKRFFRNDTYLTVIDVGQGSSSLIEFPGGECMLIDGGGFSDNSAFDVGANVIAPLLWRKKIRSIDTVVLSHPDSDHMNGLLYILENFHVDEVWSNGLEAETSGYQRFISKVHQNGIRHRICSAGFHKNIVEGVTIRVLWPPEYSAETSEMIGTDSNNNSLVVKAELNNMSFLFPGDIMAKAEEILTAKNSTDLKSTVLVAPHHGSNTSSTTGFINAVDPEVVLMSAGWRNRFRMPHVPVLKRYGERECCIYRTDKEGAIQIRAGTGGFDIRTVLNNLSTNDTYQVCKRNY